jgi:hypothetical protein
MNADFGPLLAFQWLELDLEHSNYPVQLELEPEEKAEHESIYPVQSIYSLYNDVV